MRWPVMVVHIGPLFPCTPPSALIYSLSLVLCTEQDTAPGPWCKGADTCPGYYAGIYPGLYLCSEADAQLTPLSLGVLLELEVKGGGLCEMGYSGMRSAMGVGMQPLWWCDLYWIKVTLQ